MLMAIRFLIEVGPEKFSKRRDREKVSECKDREAALGNDLCWDDCIHYPRREYEYSERGGEDVRTECGGILEDEIGCLCVSKKIKPKVVGTKKF